MPCHFDIERNRSPKQSTIQFLLIKPILDLLIAVTLCQVFRFLLLIQTGDSQDTKQSMKSSLQVVTAMKVHCAQVGRSRVIQPCPRVRVRFQIYHRTNDARHPASGLSPITPTLLASFSNCAQAQFTVPSTTTAQRLLQDHCASSARLAALARHV